uniref:Genome polyprotein n=1 Tax=Sapelovirus A TaxID=686984 RepID=A0A7S9TQ55_9PICO|nr:polyprotein [Sapelovirus A]
MESTTTLSFCNWTPKKQRARVFLTTSVTHEKSTGPYTYVVSDMIMKENSRTSLAMAFVEGKTLVFNTGTQLGQVHSANTGNKPQGAYNHGSGSITQVNYYGSDYSQAWNPTQQQMDPSQFTKPVTEIANAMAGPSLKAPDKEEAGYSDRLMQLTAGNSCITTQEAAKAVVAYGQWPSYNIDGGEHLDLATTPGTAVDRFYTFDSLQWGNTQIGEWSLPLPGGLMDTGVFGQNLRFHYLSRMGFCVHVQCNASKFHQGALIVAMIPEHQTPTQVANGFAYRDGVNYQGNNYPTEQLTVFPHQIINLRTNNSATIVYPYTNCTPAGFGLAHNFVTLVIRVLVPLRYNEGASTFVPITVSVAPMCSMFAGLRSAVARQGFPVRQVPGSQQFMTTQRDNGIPIYPEFEKTHGFKLPGRVTNLLQVAQVGTFLKFRNNVNDASGVYLNLDVTQGSQTARIAAIDVSMISEHLVTTYLSRLAQMYANYRGSVVFEFMFCGSQMATGKLLIAYTPPGGSSPTTRNDAMLATHVIWDIGLQSTCKLVVPYISASQYRQNNVNQTTLSYNGWVTVFQQTALVVPPGAPSTCQLVVTVSAADNFVMRIPTDTAYFANYQGDVKDEVQAIVNRTLQDALNTRPQKEQSSNGIMINQGDAPALTAAETGESDTNAGGSTMELQATNCVFSLRETDLEYLMSRYSLMYEDKLDYTNNQGSRHLRYNLDFRTIGKSSSDITKFKAFTYWKFDLDVVVMLLEDKPAAVKNLMFQVLYTPHGGVVPDRHNSRVWNAPNSTSVYTRVGDCPASFRIPFMSVCNYYTSFYDGDGNFDRNGASYGINPGNFIGTIAVRLANDIVTAEVSGSFRVKIFLRPVNIEAYMPRPLIAYKANGDAVQDSSTYYPASQAGFYPAEQLGPYEICQTRNASELIDTKWAKYSCSVRFDRGSFTAWFVGEDLLLVPYHAANNWSQTTHVFLWRAWDKDWRDHPELEMKIPIEDMWTDSTRDLTFLKIAYATPYWLEMPAIRSAIGDYIVVVNSAHFPWKQYSGPKPFRHPYLHVGQHTQYRLWMHAGDADNGFCGAGLISRGKLYGIVTARTEAKSGGTFVAYTELDEDTFLQTQQRCFDFGMDSHFNLGMHDWVQGLGQVFGEGVSGEVKRQVEDYLGQIKPIIDAGTNKVKDVIKDEMVSASMSLLVKVVASLVLYMNSKDDCKMSTLASLGALLGVDIFLTDPIMYLYSKITGEPHKQGPSEWLKEFNIAINAFKGFDFLCSKLMQLIEWIKQFFQRVEPEYKYFKELLESWPKVCAKVLEFKNCKTTLGQEDICQIKVYIDKLIELGNKYGHKFNLQMSQLLQCSNIINKAYSNMTRSRHEPVAMLIHGAPGTGKSLATEIIGRAIADKLDNQRPYTLPPDPKHFDGYNQQKVVIMDDLGQNPDGEDCKMFCQMVSTTTYIPPMASLDEKGLPFISDFVLASTNQHALTPRTIAEPDAINRRWFMNVDIHLKKEFKDDRGRLDMSKCIPCKDCKPTNFRKCNPLVCGKAIILLDRKTQKNWTVDSAVTHLLEESERRKGFLNVVDAIFQGPVQVPECVREDEVKKKRVNSERDIPHDVMELVRCTKSPVIIDELEKAGFIIPVEAEVIRQTNNVNNVTQIVSATLASLAAIISVGTVVYLMVRLFSSKQGAYTGAPKPETRRPVLRKAVVQGPDMEFAKSIMRSNLCQVTTSVGPFTGLGIYDNILVLPRHAYVSGNIVLDGVDIPVTDAVELEAEEGNLELVQLTLKRNEKFRDIRKFLSNGFHSENDCWLCINSEMFSNVYIPLKSVSAFGFLNLSMTPTYRTLVYNYPTKMGQCGGVVLKAGKILGIHIGGDGTRGFAALLKRDYFVNKQGLITEKYTPSKPVNVRTKTAFHPSVFHDVFPGSKEPAAMSVNDPRLEVDLEEAIFAKYKGNVDTILPEEALIAIDHLVSKFKAIVPDNLCEKMSLEDVVYGTENLDGLDLTTSAGYPYNTMGIRKKDLIPPKGQSLSPLIKALDLYGYDLPFTTYLKDELRPKEKVKMGKTRVIECSSLNDTIMMKQTFGHLFQTCHKNPGTYTGVAVGCNPDVDWSKFAAEIGDAYVCAFDYTNWDASLSPLWFDALKLFLSKLGYSGRDLVLIDQLCYSNHIYKNKGYKVTGGMPSGCSGTSIFNSIINNIVIRTIIMLAYKNINLDELLVLCYGDDLLVAYPYELDPNVLVPLAKSYGLTITPADKSTTFQTGTKLTDVTFLKRGFKFDEEYPFLCHPVFPMEEVHESIRWTKNASYTQEHVTSLCLLAWHNGEEVYEEFCTKIRSVPVGRALILPPYSQLRRSWLDMF